MVYTQADNLKKIKTKEQNWDKNHEKLRSKQISKNKKLEIYYGLQSQEILRALPHTNKSKWTKSIKTMSQQWT